MRRTTEWSRWSGLLLAAAIVFAAHHAAAQETYAWDATKYFQFNIENVIVGAPGVCTGTLPPTGAVVSDLCPKVKVIFSVTDPTQANAPWDLGKSATGLWEQAHPFTQGGVLRIDIGWTTKEYVNTASRFTSATAFSLMPVPINPDLVTPPQGVGAAMPIQVNGLAATPCTVDACPGITDVTGRYWVSSSIPPQSFGVVGSGVVAIEGHPQWQITVNGVPTVVAVPVKSVVKPFAITDQVATARRQVVDFATKCSRCHDGNHTGIPRVAMHGGSRNEEPKLCPVCHNPNQTDIPYRTTLSPASPDPLVLPNGTLGHAPEVSVDFKRLVHGIHSGGFRTNPFVVVGFKGNVYDFSGVRFPAKLENCLNCHIDVNGKGTFELPLATSVLGSTVKTGSVIVDPTTTTHVGTAGSVSLDPTDNLRITPIASVCSSCHDEREVLQHMRSKGASFGVTQSDPRYTREQCALCHGPGKDKDVRKVHEVSSTTGSTSNPD